MTPALLVLERNALVYRRTWRGGIFVSFLSPVLFLAAMGLGLGSLVSRSGAQTIGGVPYLDFLAPGLLAATTMQTAANDMMYPIRAKIFWRRTYEAMLATPLEVNDLLLGELGWLTIRLTIVAATFFVVMVLFGAVHSIAAVLAIPVAVLTGLAFGAPILAYTGTQRRGISTGFNVVIRFVILPLFLLGGTFFPIARLPVVLQVIAWMAPLAHGVALVRGLTLAAAVPMAWLNIAVLVIYAGVGTLAARITLGRRLVT